VKWQYFRCIGLDKIFYFHLFFWRHILLHSWKYLEIII
jgi:hypothetical protein